MPAQRKYPPELRERAMRLVHEAREEDSELSMHQAVQRIGSRVGVNADTLRGWCKQADIDAGKRPGTTSGDAQKIKQLEAEVRELAGPADRGCAPAGLAGMEEPRGARLTAGHKVTSSRPGKAKLSAP